MGTPGFAAGVLQKLIDGNYTIAGVVTSPDKRVGRGRTQVSQSEVKILALAHNIPVLQPEKLKAPEFLDALRALNADLQIVVAFRMLPEVVWQMPPMGTFNLHASLLPQYRGAAPINRAIMNGETKTGVTTFFLQQAIDTGNILFREEIPIGENENAGELHDRLMETGAALVCKTVDAIAEGSCRPVPQQELIAAGETLHEAPKIFREDCRINWKQEGKCIHDFIRGLSPYPGAWTTLKVQGSAAPVEIKIFRTRFVPQENAAAGEIKFPDVKLAGGTLEILELQIPGKKKMLIDEVLRGYPFRDVEME